MSPSECVGSRSCDTARWGDGERHLFSPVFFACPNFPFAPKKLRPSICVAYRTFFQSLNTLRTVGDFHGFANRNSGFGRAYQIFYFS